MIKHIPARIRRMSHRRRKRVLPDWIADVVACEVINGQAGAMRLTRVTVARDGQVIIDVDIIPAKPMPGLHLHARYVMAGGGRVIPDRRRRAR